MTLALGLLALVAAPHLTPSSFQTAAPPAVAASKVSDTAREWLELLDEGRWDESYRRTGVAFRKLNTLAVWTAASEKVRRPLGTVVSRTLISQENLPAPPRGYDVVKFRTKFANGADAVETVTLDDANGIWRVVGVTVG